MSQAGLSQVRLAAAVGVDPKTVERWVAQGRTPHPRHRVAVSDALGCDVAALWGDVDRAEAAAQEIVGVYPARRADAVRDLARASSRAWSSGSSCTRSRRRSCPTRRWT